MCILGEIAGIVGMMPEARRKRESLILDIRTPYGRESQVICLLEVGWLK